MDKGSFVKIAVNHEVIQLLGDDGSCVQTKGIDASKPFDSCMYDEMKRIMLKEVGGFWGRQQRLCSDVRVLYLQN